MNGLTSETRQNPDATNVVEQRQRYKHNNNWQKKLIKNYITMMTIHPLRISILKRITMTPDP